MTAHVSSDVTFGVTCLLVDGKLTGLLKCPFCDFRNIHKDEITHHIKYKDDVKHDIDLDKLDKNTYFVIKNKRHSRYKYETKEDLPLPSMKCLWCSYQDKVIRDLEYHFLDNHKIQLYKEIRLTSYERRAAYAQDPYSFMYESIDLILEKAVRVAKQRSGLNVQTNF